LTSEKHRSDRGVWVQKQKNKKNRSSRAIRLRSSVRPKPEGFRTREVGLFALQIQRNRGAPKKGGKEWYDSKVIIAVTGRDRRRAFLFFH